MRKHLSILVIAILARVQNEASAQGTFQNLDFESAKIIPVVGSPYYPYGIAVTNALPGWNVYYGTNQQSQITYNDPSVGSTWVNLWATNGAVIEGNFSVLLQGGSVGGLYRAPATISQTGVVPIGAQSLLFKAESGIGALTISLGGISLPFYALSTGVNYTLYGCDISSFGGQTDELSFSALPPASAPLSNWEIDSIQFSNQQIPEPSTFAFIFTGALLLCTRYRRNPAFILNRTLALL